MMKHIFIVNPKAGKKDSSEYIKSILEKRTDIDYIIYNTKSCGDATRYVKEILDNDKINQYRFYACGGDGTVNEVVKFGITSEWVFLL